MLYAYLLGPQPSEQVVITSLGTNSPHINGTRVQDVNLIGGPKLEWSQEEQGLSVKLPEKLPGLEAVGLRIRGVL